MSIVTLNPIAASDFFRTLTPPQVAEMRAFARREVGHVADVVSVGYDVIDCPLLRVTRYDRDKHGDLYLDDHDEIAKLVTEHPLRGQLPEWWKP